jgi:hypothetical protein
MLQWSLIKYLNRSDRVCTRNDETFRWLFKGYYSSPRNNSLNYLVSLSCASWDWTSRYSCYLSCLVSLCFVHHWTEHRATAVICPASCLYVLCIMGLNIALELFFFCLVRVSLRIRNVSHETRLCVPFISLYTAMVFILTSTQHKPRVM